MAGRARAIDLKLRLALRVAALAAVCFLAVAAYALFDSDRAARAKASRIAEIVAKDISLQQAQAQWYSLSAERNAGFATGRGAVDGAGALHRLSGQGRRLSPGHLQRRARRRNCRARKLRCALSRHLPSRRTDLDAATHRRQGRRAWRSRPSIRPPRSARAGARRAACSPSWLSRWRGFALRSTPRWRASLRPTHAIRAGLKQLAANDLSARLPSFDLAELSAISDVFNALAQKLEATLAERNALTRKLIAVQDEERRHLARELHDEFGQSLTAIAAQAAAAAHTAERECPPLFEECRGISRTTAGMMADAARSAGAPAPARHRGTRPHRKP